MPCSPPNTGSRSSRLTAEPFMHQHFQQGLATDALACRDLTGFRNIRFGQSQGNLSAGSPVQSADEARSLSCACLLRSFNRFPLYEFAARATGPPVCLFRLVNESRHVPRSLFIDSLPLHPPGRIVLFCPASRSYAVTTRIRSPRSIKIVASSRPAAVSQ